MSSSEEDYTSDSESISSSTFSSTSSSDPNSSIYVGQLPPFINETHLRQHFSDCHIISCFVVRDKVTKISKGFAFIRLESEEATDRAVTIYNKSLITGKHSIAVRKKLEKKKEGGQGKGRRGRRKGLSSSDRKGSSSSDRIGSSSSERKESASSLTGDNVVKVWVGNIPPGITEDHLMMIFSRFKEKMVRPIDPIRVGDKNSRYSFLSFGSLEDSTDIISKMNGVVLKDHKIVLQPSRPNPKEKKFNARLCQVSDTCNSPVLFPEQGSSTVVQLTKLSSEISSTDLSELVSVHSSNIVINSHANTASIVFPSQQAASEAVQKLNGQKFLGSTIRAFISTTGASRSSSTSSTTDSTPTSGLDNSSITVNNLPLGTKKEDVRSYFSSFGPIVKCDIINRNKQETSCSAVVTFKSPSSASSAVSFNGHSFLGRSMEISLKKTASKDSSIIVSGLSPVTTGADIFNCFKSYGRIIGKVNVNKTHPRRCTIKYAMRDSAERAIREINGTTFKGSVLTVQYCDEEEEENDGDITDDVASQLESHLRLGSTQKRFSEKKVISSEIYELWVDNSSSEIESFELKGGTYQYSKGTLTLSAFSQEDINLLTKKISIYRERILECSAVQWNQLVVVDELGVSKMDQLKSPFTSIPDLRIIERPPLKLLFVGPETTVDSAYYHFFNEFGKELLVDSLKMEALLEMNEDLCKDILKKYRVRIRGFSTGSTKLTFEGNSSSLPLARSAVETALAIIKPIPLPSSLSTPLVRAGLGICEKEGITCSVFIHEGQPMLAFLSEDHLQRGERIFKRKPFTNFVRIKDGDSHSVKSLEGVISSDRVHIELTEDSILLKSFEKEDVQEARKEIEEFIGTAVKEEELFCTPEQKVYIKKKLNSTEMKENFPNVVVRRDSVCIQGMQADRLQSSKALLGLVPKYYDTVIIQCNRRFYPLIEQHVIQPLSIECIVANDGPGYRRRGRGGKDKESSGEGASNELKLYVYSMSSLEPAIDVLKSMTPNTLRVPVNPKAKELVEKMKADIENECLCKIVINNHPNFLIHSLGQRESQKAKRLILEGIKKQLIIFKHLPSPPIPALHLKYLIEMYKDRFDEVSEGLELFHLPRKRPFDVIGPDETDSIKVKGTGEQVDAVKDMLDELIGESEFRQKRLFLSITFPPYLLRLWRKVWNFLREAFKEKHNVLIEYKCPESCGPGSQVEFCIYGFNYESFKMFQSIIENEHSKPLVVTEIPLPIERVKEVHAALTEHKLDFRDYIVDVYCNEKARKIIIRAPDFIKEDMETVQDEIENFLEETSIVKDNMSLIDVPTYLLFTSLEHGYYKQALSYAKGTRVILRSYRHGQNVGCTLTGTASKVEILKLQLGSILKSIKPLLGYIHVPVDPLALPSLTPTFCSDINSKLESQFMTVLIKKSSSSPPSSPPQQQSGSTWHWRDSDGSFVPHSASVSKELSAGYKTNPSNKYIVIDNGKAIEVDFYSMVQTDLATGIKKQVSFTSSGSIQWYWTSDDCTKLVPYTSKDSDYIENMYKMKHTVFSTTINQQSYLIDTLAMIQKNVKTGRSRKIERKATTSASSPKQSSTVRLYGLKTKLDAASQHVQDKLSQCLKTNELTNPLLSNPKFYAEVQKIASKHNVQTIQRNPGPSNDRKGFVAAKPLAHVAAGGGGSFGSLLFKGVGFCINKVIQEVQERIIDSKAVAAAATSSDVPPDVPPEWEPQEANLKLFSVPSSSAEYQRVESLFKKTLRNSRILTITRIQNMWLHEKYVQHKDRLALKNKGKINELELFHGTRGTDPKEIFDSEEGFDMRFSASGMWGQANYFASDASYSHLYSHKHPSGYNEIFLVKLLAGESYESQPDSSLRMPPKIKKPKGELQTRYDTVAGTTRGTRVFMAYDNQKAYPAYLIVYAA